MHNWRIYLLVIYIFLLNACRPAPSEHTVRDQSGTPTPQDQAARPTAVSTVTHAVQSPTQIQPAMSLGASIQALAISSTTQTLAVGTQERIVLVDRSSWSVLWQSSLSQANNGVAFSPDGEILCATSDTGRITIWKVESPNPVRVLFGPLGSAGGVAFSPDGGLLAVGFSRTVQIWDTQSWQKKQTLSGHNNVIWRLAFSKNGRTLASASTDQTIQLWDMTQQDNTGTPAPLQVLRSPTYWLRSMSFSPGDLTLAGASGDGIVYVWDTHNGERLFTLKGDQGFIWDVAYAPAGDRLAAASEDGSIVIWDTGRGEILQKWQYQSPVHTIAFDSLTPVLFAGLANGNLLTIPYQ